MVMVMDETCRDCALPWTGVPCRNCGCCEPAGRPVPTQGGTQPGRPGRRPAKAATPGRVAAVKRASTTVTSRTGDITITQID